jgi:hypothetical protein
MIDTMQRRRLAIVLGLAVAVGLGAAPASASPPFTLAAKTKADPNPALPTQLWRIRTGNQGGWDRVVFDERFSPSGYTVRYVSTVYRDPSGMVVPMKGKAFLQVTVPDAGTDGAAGAPTFIPASRTYTLPEVKQIVKTGEFERVVSFAIGLKAKRGFRVLRLTNPLRLAIDIKH